MIDVQLTTLIFFIGECPDLIKSLIVPYLALNRNLIP
jgi:hypothetical protein